MNRDSYFFLGFILLFAAVNIGLLAAGTLQADWEGFGIVVAVGFTLALYSFLYKDNPLFKFAEHVFVGVAAAYVFGQVWYSTLYGEIVGPMTGSDDFNNWLLIPTFLGLLMLTRFSQRLGWLSRISFAFVVGVGSGLSIPRTISSQILAQLEPTMQPLSWSFEGFNLLLILVGVVAVLVYFFFSVEHTGAVGHVSRLGIWFLMISFGASFGFTIMGRLSLFIGRMQFLMGDWLHLIE